MAERVRDTEQLRESMREIERKRVVRVVLGLELGFRKITILPLKNVKINQKKKAFHVSALYPFTDRNSRILPVWSVFFSKQNKGVLCTSLLAGTVYIGHTGQYGTEFTSLATTELGKK